MEYLNIRDIETGDHSDAVIATGEAVSLALLAATDAVTPRLDRIGVGDGDLDAYLYEFEVALAEGVTLPIEHGYVEGIAGGWSDNVTPEGAAAAVLAEVHALLPRVDELADVLHAARSSARRLLGDWHASGLPMRLVDVRLAPLDHWRGDANPHLEVLLEKLDARLESVIDAVPVGTIEELPAALAEVRTELEQSFATRGRLMRLGASGTIDQLALNAMAHHGDLAEQVRWFASEWRFWLPDGTCVLLTNGHASAGTGSPDARVQWLGDWMSVDMLHVEDDRLKAAVGKPVEDLIDHPFLSDDMIVLDANCSKEGGRWTLNIRFNNERRLFCSKSGRVWDVPHGIGETVSDTHDQRVVIPFKRRPAA